MREFNKQVVCGFLLVLTIVLSPLVSFAGAGTPFKKVVFFGDSLTDNGNLYSKDGHFMPKSPPYYKGRFSNGPTWAEFTAAYYKVKAQVAGDNYAYGGETAVQENPFDHFSPYTLEDSYWTYRTLTVFRDKSTTLFVIWIGSNDYLNGSAAKGQNPNDADVATLTSQVVNEIKDTVQKLIGAGGQDFILVNLPDFSKIPYALQSDASTAGNLKALSIAHNQRLAAAVEELRNSNKSANIQLYDVNAVFNNLLSSPDTFNRQFQINITNTKDACWNGGYSSSGLQNMTPVDAKVDANQVAQDYLTYLNEHKQSLKAEKNSQMNDIQGFANFVAHSPALSEAYKVGKEAANDVPACSNPDNYVFWDHVHPTAVVHKALAQEFNKFIDAHYRAAS